MNISHQEILPMLQFMCLCFAVDQITKELVLGFSRKTESIVCVWLYINYFIRGIRSHDY